MGALYRQFIERSDLSIDKWHDYFPIYEVHLSKFRGTKVKMLEIGVQRGGSARLFSDWLGPDAHLTGVDIDERCRLLSVRGQLDIEIGDQADRNFLRSLAERHGPWDIILDDGGHTANQIFTSFEVLFHHLNDGGVYLIEDTHAHFWGGSFLDHPEKQNIIHFVAGHFKSMHLWTGRRQLYGHWRVPPPERKQEIPLPYIAAHMRAMHLYDSVVVIDKGKRREPFLEARTLGQDRKTKFRFEEYEQESEVVQLRAELDVMRQSRSWRMTAPLRRISKFVRGERQ